MNPAAKRWLHHLADNLTPRIPVALLRGTTGTLLLAGEDRWTRYLPQRFFPEPPTRRELGRVFAWQLPAILTRHPADLIIARVDLITAQRFPPAAYLRVPEWIRMIAPVPPATDDLRHASRSARDDIRVIRRERLTWRISHDPADLATHYRRDYLPYTRHRHGDDAFVQSWNLIRRVFRRGGLLWVERAGDPLAGLVFEIRSHTFQMWTLAPVRADEQLLHHGAIAALYYFAFDCARRLGLTAVDMRGCRPSLHDNLYRFKRKWGAHITDHPDNAYDWLIRWPATTPAILHFLAHTSLIFRDHHGLAALHADPATPPAQLHNPGLRRLHRATLGAPLGTFQTPPQPSPCSGGL